MMNEKINFDENHINYYKNWLDDHTAKLRESLRQLKIGRQNLYEKFKEFEKISIQEIKNVSNNTQLKVELLKHLEKLKNEVNACNIYDLIDENRIKRVDENILKIQELLAEPKKSSVMSYLRLLQVDDLFRDYINALEQNILDQMTKKIEEIGSHLEEDRTREGVRRALASTITYIREARRQELIKGKTGQELKEDKVQAFIYLSILLYKKFASLNDAVQSHAMSYLLSRYNLLDIMPMKKIEKIMDDIRDRTDVLLTSLASSRGGIKEVFNEKFFDSLASMIQISRGIEEALNTLEKINKEIGSYKMVLKQCPNYLEIIRKLQNSHLPEDLKGRSRMDITSVALTCERGIATEEELVKSIYESKYSSMLSSIEDQLEKLEDGLDEKIGSLEKLFKGIGCGDALSGSGKTGVTKNITEEAGLKEKIDLLDDFYSNVDRRLNECLKTGQGSDLDLNRYDEEIIKVLIKLLKESGRRVKIRWE